MGDFDIGTVKDKPFLFPKENLKKHFIALGASGSGKTVIAKAMIEECALNGIPSIVVDVQGDLAALALQGDDKTFHEKIAVTIFTPLSTKGVPICINPLEISQENIAQEELIPLLHSVATTLSKLLGYNTSNDKGKFAQTILYLTLKYSYETKTELETFGALVNLLVQPPEKLAEEIQVFLHDKNELHTLVRKIKFMDIGEKRLLFQSGVPVNIGEFLKPINGKTHIAVIYLNTLPSQEEKEFFLTALTTKVYEWMLANPSNKLQCAYFIDEVAPFLPAGSEKPMPKTILKRLFKQARKYGVGCLLATQNPGDIDYKALAQFGTWAIGRMTVKQDIKKIEQVLKSDKLSTTRLKPGEFLLFAPDIDNHLIQLKTRWLKTKHITMSEDDIKKASKDSKEYYKHLAVSLEESKEKYKEFEKKENEPIIIKQSEFHFPTITPKEAMRLAKRKQQKIFGLIPDEKLLDVKPNLKPYYMVTVKAVESFIIFKTNKTYTLVFDDEGQLIKMKGKSIRSAVSKEFLKLTENELVVARAVMHTSNQVSVAQVMSKTDLGRGSVTKALNDLTKKRLIAYEKVGSYKLYAGNGPSNHVFRVASKTPRLISQEVIRPHHSKLAKQIVSFIHTWFNNTYVTSIKPVFLTEYTVTYAKGKSVRKITINGLTKQVY